MGQAGGFKVGFKRGQSDDLNDDSTIVDREKSGYSSFEVSHKGVHGFGALVICEHALLPISVIRQHPTPNMVHAGYFPDKNGVRAYLCTLLPHEHLEGSHACICILPEHKLLGGHARLQLQVMRQGLWRAVLNFVVQHTVLHVSYVSRDK